MSLRKGKSIGEGAGAAAWMRAVRILRTGEIRSRSSSWCKISQELEDR
jgi:hypothetical protein